ncbi:carbohydrate ABC transporter permease [Tenggerimyces flavus]|uniref:Carbohydrate ABC transporter permease n=1 Tax=Tenggerimyces flavus TaxID=1708749 RepID=A0ABV7YN07_9ACTN|nr:carbohydrate ABC transporter permease [Tenggerimyces flavus]MBM7784851.1 multiple sugar transport system permease protein [Tenggerimyces flavus]
MRRLLANLGTYALLIAGALITLGPYVLSFGTSLKSPQQFAREPTLTPPDPVTFTNYAALFSGRYDFIPPLAITIQVVVVILVGQLVCSVLAAYAFARVRFPGREALFWIYLATLMVPQVVTLIPLYTMFSQVGLRDTFWGIVLPTLLGSPYAIFLLREYFRGIPEDLISAARLDGAGTLRILRHVIVPMSRPILATLTIITIVTHWNNFLWPLIITSSDKWRVLTVATASLQSQYNGNWTLVMAAATVAMAPLVVLFLVFQRHVVRSISLTGLK